jgi:hypothetical protein
MGQFSFDANAGETPQSLEAKRAIANAMLKQGMDTSPIVSPFQGLARIAEALSGSYTNFHANKDEAGYKNTAINNANSALSPIVQSLLGGGQLPAAPGPQVSGAAPPPSLMEDVMAKAPAYPGHDGITAADQGGVFKPTLPPTQVASAQPPLITPTAAQPAAQPIPPPQGAPQPPQAPPQAPQGQQGPIGPEAVQALMAAASNPWLPDDQKQMARTLLSSVIQRMDPAAQIELKTKQLQLDQIEHPKPTYEKVGDELVQLSSDGTVKPIYSSGREPAKPAAVQEYEYAAQQGFKGTFQDWESSKKGGMSLTVDPTTGEVSFQQGGNIKPLTEAQGKDAVFYTRAKGALDNLDLVGNSLTSPVGAVAGQLPGGNYLKSSDYQKAEQAGNEFLTAILRKDSGAAIGKEEQANYGNIYLPRPGDSTETLVQKKGARLRAIEALRSGMTPQAILQSELALKKTSPPPADAQPTPAPGVGSFTWTPDGGLK